MMEDKCMPYSQKEKQRCHAELEDLIQDLDLVVKIVELKGGIL